MAQEFEMKTLTLWKNSQKSESAYNVKKFTKKNESAFNVKKFTKNENAFLSTFWASRIEYNKEAEQNEKIFIGEKFHKCKYFQVSHC